MKRTAVILSVLISVFTSAQVKWYTLSQAVEAQKKTPKKIFIDFYTDWCAPCRIMDKNTYGHPVIAAYLNEQYYPVKFNAESPETVKIFGRTYRNENYKSGAKKNSMHEFTRYMNVNAVPSAVFLDDNGNPITILQGALSAKELEPYLPFIANDDYKKLKTREEWETFQKKFRSKIKD